MDLMALGTRIRRRRERRGLKQADLAASLRLSPQAVSKWERGENAPDISLLVPLAQRLDVSVEWLLGGGPAERETFAAVVLVTGVQGYAARAERDGPRALATWINGVHATVTEAVRQRGGVPVKYTGDGFLAFFSGAEAAPRARAAAEAALAGVDHPGLVVALDAGDIYLGTIGHPDYAALDILGAPVNGAFTLLAATPERPPERVTVSPRVQALLQNAAAPE